jgi:uncharacterized protein YecE (DUF72 family)
MRRYLIGTSGWAYDDWKGPFYPPRTRSSDYLAWYAEHFDAVEVDSSFYGMPRQKTIRRWCEVTPPAFRFAVKCPRQITHERQLVDVAGLGAHLQGVLEPFGDKLAAFLFQFPPSFHARHLIRLQRLLEQLPGELPWALELRHPSWLDVDAPALAREHGVAWVNTDRLSAREVCAPFVYVRLLGDQSRKIRFDRVINDVDADLEAWSAWLTGLPSDVHTVLGFVNNHYSGHSPATASALRRQLGLAAVQVPRQGQLFPGP